jgi:hypothetical protein
MIQTSAVSLDPLRWGLIHTGVFGPGKWRGQVALPTIRPADDHRAQLDSLCANDAKHIRPLISSAGVRGPLGESSAKYGFMRYGPKR